MKKILLLFVLTIFIWSGQAFADENYTGRWYISISGQQYIMDLTQKDNEVQGILYPQHKDNRGISIVHGTADGKIIDLLSSNKDLSIILHLKGAIIGNSKTQALVGHYTINNRHLNKWHALRYERKSYFGSPNSGYSIVHNFDTPPNPF